MKKAPRDKSYFWAFTGLDFVLAYGNHYGYFDLDGNSIYFVVWRKLEKPTL